jgi:hypothetical protein
VCDVGRVSGGFLVAACHVFVRFSVLAGTLFMMLRRLFAMFYTSFTHNDYIGLVCQV